MLAESPHKGDDPDDGCFITDSICETIGPSDEYLSVHSQF